MSELVMDGADGELALEFFEGLLDFGELKLARLSLLTAKTGYFAGLVALEPASIQDRLSKSRCSEDLPSSHDQKYDYPQ